MAEYFTICRVNSGEPGTRDTGIYDVDYYKMTGS